MTLKKETNKKTSNRTLAQVVLFCALLTLPGCFKVTPPVETLTEAHQKFLDICQKDYNINVHLTPIDNTLYIYAPIEEAIFKYKATPKNPLRQDKKNEKRLVNYVEATIKNSTVAVEYDIINTRSYPKDLGYGTEYSEKASNAQRGTLMALYQAYGDLNIIKTDLQFGIDGSISDEEQTIIKNDPVEAPMDFVVFTVADIHQGLAIKSTFYFQDHKNMMSSLLPYEEYQKRLLSGIEGDQAFIGNTDGKDLEYKPVLWEDFLCRQIENRVYKVYVEKDFLPEDDNVNEIAKAVAATLNAYPDAPINIFQIKIQDLVTEQTSLFDQSQLKTFLE